MTCKHCGQRIISINLRWEHVETCSVNCYDLPPVEGIQQQAEPEDQ